MERTADTRNLTGGAAVPGVFATQTGPSKSAIWSAVQRAAHQLLDPDPRILCDPFARAFAGYHSDDDLLRAIDGQKPKITERSRLGFALRHRYVEDRLAMAWERGIAQYLILGAGLDSFAYRCPVKMAGLAIVEVDHPVTQEWKRTRVAQLGIDQPINLRHLAIDFERQTLGERLAADGSVDLTAPLYISCLGLTQYLTKGAFRTMLRDIARIAPAGSELALQFIPPLDTVTGEDPRGFQWGLSYWASVGEPWRSFYTPAEIDSHLQEAGFHGSTLFAAEQAAARYLPNRRDGVRLSPLFHIASANIGDPGTCGV